jgi:hypothetical protein
MLAGIRSDAKTGRLRDFAHGLPWRPDGSRSRVVGPGGHVLDRTNHAGRNRGRLLIGTASMLLGLISLASCSDPLRGGSPGAGGAPGSGGQVGTGGASLLGGSGGATTGGMTGSGGTEARCPALPCPANPCPEGDTPLPLFDCSCSGPCGCWQCVSAPKFSTGGTVSSGGASGSSGIGGTILHGGTSGPSGSGGVVTSGGVTGNGGGIPVSHRPSDAQCPSQRGPGPSGQPYSGFYSTTCSTDSQCTAGRNGRCFPYEGLVGPGGCSYDECFSDSNCGARTPCLCRSSSTDNSANVCDIGGNCAVDSDCGPGGYCSPSAQVAPNQPTNVCWGSTPYYCRTASDLCINDSDCAPLDAGPPTTSSPTYTCAYNPQDNRWECTQAVCALP